MPAIRSAKAKVVLPQTRLISLMGLKNLSGMVLTLFANAMTVDAL